MKKCILHIDNINTVTYRKDILQNPVLGKLNSEPVRVFFIGFLNTPCVAHLATEKEQSRENFMKGLVYQREQQDDSHERKVKLCRFSEPACIVFNTVAPFIFPNTSIKQYLPVPAMSNLTTGDLEIDSISIVTWVGDHQSLNTRGVVRIGEETRMRTFINGGGRL